MSWDIDTVTVKTQPASELLDFADVLDYTKASPSDQRTLVILTVGCRADLEKRLGRALSQQTLECVFVHDVEAPALIVTPLSRSVPLYLPPVNTVSKVEGLIDPDTWYEYTADYYDLQEHTLVLSDDMGLAAVDGELRLRVTYTVGPELLSHADRMMLLQYIAHKYAYREDDTLPDNFGGLTRREKVWRL
jgi:hypothetical protein